jgi:type II secretory pathway pseudopilin PulG
MVFLRPPRQRSGPDPFRFLGRGSGAAGFTILEVVVAATVLALATSAGAVLSGVSSRSLTSGNRTSLQQSQIEADLAAIRDLAATYTWCSGAGAFSTCTAGVPARSENYYFPPSTNPSAISAFETACSATGSDTVNTVLVSAINARPAPAGVSRTVASDDIATRRLRLTYAGSSVNRVVLLVPTVAAWCP